MPDPSPHPDVSRFDGWTRVIVAVDAAAAELAADLLWRSGAAGIEEQDADGATVLLAGFADGATAAAAAEALAAAGHAGATTAAVTDDGLDAWRAFAEPVRAGRFWLTPTWLDAPAAMADGEVLWLDPGRTFGSGSHPTTRLVLDQLDHLVRPGQAVLDVGCGSGVLAIGAARLGAGSVVAIDIDPASPGVTAANADRNDVGHLVHASDRPLADVAADALRFDVVAANLLAPVVAELADHLVAVVASHGHLVVSGLLADQWEASAALLAPLVVRDVHTAEGWAAVVLGWPDAAGR